MALYSASCILQLAFIPPVQVARSGPALVQVFMGCISNMQLPPSTPMTTTTRLGTARVGAVEVSEAAINANCRSTGSG